MSSSTRVSVIVPLYNRQELVRDTINSVITQSIGDWELIIVDDGSTDDSFEVARHAVQNDKRIWLGGRTREPKGAPTCRNQGLQRATGEYTMFLDSDDLLAPTCLEHRLSRFAQYPEHDFLAFGSKLFDEHPGDSNDVWGLSEDDCLSGFLNGPVWNVVCPIWRTSWIKQIGGWREGLPSWQDWELHVRALSFEPRFEYFPDERDTFIRRTLQNRISMVSAKQCAHLRARAQMFADVATLLEERELLNRPRRASLARRLIDTSVLQDLAGAPEDADETLDRIASLKLVPASRWPLLKLYVAFESNRMLRKPVLRSSVRKALKAVFCCLLPHYAVTRQKWLRLSPQSKTVEKPRLSQNE